MEHRRTAATLQVLARHGLKNEVWQNGIKLTSLNSQNPSAYELEPYFAKQLLVDSENSAQISTYIRAAPPGQAGRPFQQRILDHDYLVNFERKSGKRHTIGKH